MFTLGVDASDIGSNDTQTDEQAPTNEPNRQHDGSPTLDTPTINQRDATEVMYGFATKDERELFELIVGISGIGAASARMILSSMSSEEFREAILSENINKIKSVYTRLNDNYRDCKFEYEGWFK